MKFDLSPKTLRKNILRMAGNGNAGHIGCAFSLVEIASTLYSKVLKYDPSNPDHDDRDILTLSKGHGAMALYAVFYQLGWLRDKHLDNYFTDGSELFGLGEDHTPGIEISGGSLGHGFPVTVGMAYGFQRKGNKKKLYCIVGDGEINEGSIWEAAMFAAHHKLNNLVIIVDANSYQAMGLTKDIIDLDPLSQKFESFGFNVLECNGHCTDQLEETFKKSQNSDKPTAIIARTVKGSGVSFMENENIWHYKKMDQKEKDKANSEIALDNPEEIS
jgi:transketolase